MYHFLQSFCAIVRIWTLNEKRWFSESRLGSAHCVLPQSLQIPYKISFSHLMKYGVFAYKQFKNTNKELGH